MKKIKLLIFTLMFCLIISGCTSKTSKSFYDLYTESINYIQKEVLTECSNEEIEERLNLNNLISVNDRSCTLVYELDGTKFDEIDNYKIFVKHFTNEIMKTYENIDSEQLISKIYMDENKGSRTIDYYKNVRITYDCLQSLGYYYIEIIFELK